MTKNHAPNHTEAEKLLHALKNHTPHRVNDIRRNIATLDSADQNFSTIANQLITNGTADPKWITKWLYSPPKTHGAISEANRRNADRSIDYTATNLILEDATLLTTMERNGYGDNDRVIWFTQAGHELLTEAAPELQPHLLASTNTVDQYYRALITATSIVNPQDEHQQFIEEAPAFIAWSKNHKELPLLLEAATRIQSLKQAPIEALMPMVRSTHSAVRDGLL